MNQHIEEWPVERRRRVAQAVYGELAAREQPGESVVVLCCLMTESWPKMMEWSRDKIRPMPVWTQLLEVLETGDMDAFRQCLLKAAWQGFTGWAKEAARDKWVAGREIEPVREIAPLFGIDLSQRYNDLAAKDERKDAGKPKKAKKKTCKSQTDQCG